MQYAIISELKSHYQMVINPYIQQKVAVSLKLICDYILMWYKMWQIKQ